MEWYVDADMMDKAPVLLVTRPEKAAGSLVKAVRAATHVPFDPVISPLLRIEAMGQPIDILGAGGVVFSSVNGVQNARFTSDAVGLKAWCVGDQTTAAAQDRGFAAVSAKGNASDLVSMILSKEQVGPLIHVRGQKARGNVADRLNDAGVECADVVVYRQVELGLTAAALNCLSHGQVVIVPLFSPNTARIFAQHAPFGARLTTVAMSPAVDDEVHDLPRMSAIISKRPDQKSVISSICTALGGKSGATGP